MVGISILKVSQIEDISFNVNSRPFREKASLHTGITSISAAQTVAQKGVKAVLNGNCGPNAHQVFSSAGIKVITGVTGKIKDAIAEYKLGTYSATEQANVPDHFGMQGMGKGGGMGRGMGRGRGMGMGGGMMSQTPVSSQPSSQEEEIKNLKAHSQE